MSSDLPGQLKALKADKGAIARQFKYLKEGSEEYLAQLEAMKAITEKIKSLEGLIKEARSAVELPAQKKASLFTSLEAMPVYQGEVTLALKAYADVPEWDEFVSRNPSNLPSHNPAWLDVITRSFGHQAFIFCAFDEQQRLLGGIPLVVLRSPLFGTFGVSIPFLNYGGALCAYANLHEQLMAGLQQVRQALNLKYLEVRSIYPGFGYHASTKKVGMILSLPDTDVILEQQLGSKLRAQYKKADHYSPRITFGDITLLDDFYRVFAHNMRDLGTPVYSKQWFSNILQHPALNTKIAVVYVDNKPVATGFLVRHGDLMEIPWASTLKSANKLNINMWMYRKILEFSIASGCQHFDFGRSTQEAGTYKFKKQWGAAPYQHYWYSILPEGAPVPELNPDNPKLKLLVTLWKWLPLWLANRIGPWIIKGIA